MPDTLTDAPSASDSPPKWIDAGEAARLLGVSQKTVWRRAKAGALAARKVARGRGGFAWEIALEATGQTTNRPDKSDRTPTEQNSAFSSSSRSKSTDRPDKSDRPTGQKQPTDRTKATDQPTGQRPDKTKK